MIEASFNKRSQKVGSMNTFSRIFSAVVFAFPGAFLGVAVSQNVAMIVHPQYVLQLQNWFQKWILAHPHASVSLFSRASTLEEYNLIGPYEIGGIICGGLIGLVFGFYIVPRIIR